MNETLYDLPALRVWFLVYLCIMGAFFGFVFLVGVWGLWMAEIFQHPWNTRRLLARAGRLAGFLALLLVVGDCFSFLWGATIFDHLYYSVNDDDFQFVFLPWWPVTQGVIDNAWNHRHGALTGVTLRELQLIWLVFAACTWIATVGLYRRMRAMWQWVRECGFDTAGRGMAQS